MNKTIITIIIAVLAVAGVSYGAWQYFAPEPEPAELPEVKKEPEQKPGVPFITSISPISGPISTEITLKGSGFMPDWEVAGEWNYPVLSFGEAKLEPGGNFVPQFKIVDDNTIKFSVPATGCKTTVSEIGGCFSQDQITITSGIYEISLYTPKKEGINTASNKVKFNVASQQ